MSNRPYYRGRPAIANRSLVAQTCKECGLILGRKHYQKINNTWRSICNSCFAKRSRKNYGANIKHHEADYSSQNESLKTATRRGQFWTLKELDTVVEALEAGFTHKEIAILVNRSHYSISQAIARFGLKKNWPTREEWIIRIPD